MAGKAPTAVWLLAEDGEGRVLVNVGSEAEELWRSKGYLAEGEAKAEPEADPRDAITAELDALGVEYDGRLGVKKLQALLDEARAAGGDGGGEAA